MNTQPRVSSMFKGIKGDRSRWHGEKLPEEPACSYLVVSEFAQRFAEQEGYKWPGYLQVKMLEELLK